MKKFFMGIFTFLVLGLFIFSSNETVKAYNYSVDESHIINIVNNLKNKALRNGGSSFEKFSSYIDVLTKTIYTPNIKPKVANLLGDIKNKMIEELPNFKNTESFEEYGVEIPEQIEQLKKDFIKLLNEYRLENGARPVGRNLQLEAGPNDFMNEIYDLSVKDISYFNHVRPDTGTGSNPGIAGYKVGTLSGEIMTGPSVYTAKQAFENFKNSPGHNRSMLRKPAKDIGIAYKKGYWIMNITCDYETLVDEENINRENYDYKSYRPVDKDINGNPM